MLACTSCPLYRNTTAQTVLPFFTDPTANMPLGTTPGNGDAQDADVDCKVIAGYGVLGSAGTDADKLALEVQECGVGAYSTGGALDSACLLCSAAAAGTKGAYSTTEGTGSTNATDCNRKFLRRGDAGSWGGGYKSGCAFRAWLQHFESLLL
jgi:hypothetical protein